MLLVDTSVWIEWFSQGAKNLPTRDELKQVVICAPVYQEILQGISDDIRFHKIRKMLLAFSWVDHEVPIERYEEAAILYRACRRQGYTIRSSTDCLIAAIALKARIPVLHRDRDFDNIAKISSLDIRKPK